MQWALVFKYNPNHDEQGRFASASGGASKIKAVFKPRAKLTIDAATQALAEQGFSLEHAGMLNFSPRYRVTDSGGNAQTYSAKELTKLLTKKEAAE